MLATDQDTTANDSLDEPEYTRTIVAGKLKISAKTLVRYLAFGADYIPALKAYVSDDDPLNGKRILESNLKYLEESQYLKLHYLPLRVSEILNHKYTILESG
ncbi:hypothetical protein [Nostoc sp.]|uniref:hypothetical protein n=1 Tax=Nostoc sp. TaxID=1180 RepID=UPI002FFCFB19